MLHMRISTQNITKREREKKAKERQMFPQITKSKTKQKVKNHVNNLVRKAKKEYFQRLTERDNNIVSLWRALDVFTKGHRSTSADLPKNITATFVNNDILSVTKPLIEPRTAVCECSNFPHDFCKQTK